MPVSAETAARSDAPSTTPIIEDQLNQGSGDQPQSSQMPSDTVEPTTVTDASQQAATEPGSGSTVQTDETGHPPRFKEKVIGYAKEIRGTALRKPDTKQQGQRIVHGEETFEPKKVGPKA
ncbi:hypothetical protein EIP86_006585 [Pleurotus ostreatoroseus]|nr:hypothetical protein EIP86_006585 [Pleurotus ostreatoroseus]